MMPQHPLREHQIHIWIADLARQGQDFLRASLSPSEQARASHFRFEKDRDAYVKSHGILRLLLGRYFSTPPEKIEISTTEFGKPYVAELLNGQSLSFNLSHSGGVAVYAFCLNHPLGVDVEVLRPMPDLDELAAQFFSASERESLQAAGLPVREKLFLQYWTRKEACLKALGLGLQISPAEVDVAAIPVPARQFTPFQPQVGAGHVWSLLDFSPTAESVAAVAVASGTKLMVEIFRV